MCPRRERRRLVERCPFCGSVCRLHCARVIGGCGWRRCMNQGCRAYGKEDDASRWAVPVTGSR